MGEMYDRMLRGERYIADDAEMAAAYARTQELLERFNALPAATPGDVRRAALRDVLEEVGEGTEVRPRLFCEYGQVRIGARTFVNVDVVLLDVAPISVGDSCQIGPRVQLLTAEHPIDPDARRAGWESARPIVIGDNVWLGGGVIVCPGVTIGDDTVVGAGAVVTSDLPSGVVAVGVPATARRNVTTDERDDNARSNSR